MYPYPFSYFSSIFSPRKMFDNRGWMTLWQRLFTTVFLVSLLIIPSSLQTLSLKTYPLENFVEGIYQTLSEEVVADLRQYATIEDNRFQYTGSGASDRVTFGEMTPTASSFSYQFMEDTLLVRNGADVLAELSYKNMQTSDFENKERLTAAISKSWYQENRAMITLSLTMVSALILSTNFLFILLGSSFFLFLTKKSRLFAFKTFAECYNFSLHCLGLPTILACVIGLFGQPITTLVTIQNILFVLCLLWVFFKTKFRNEN